jgi:hypothetical protein
MTMPQPLATIVIVAAATLLYLLWPLSPGSEIASDKAVETVTASPQPPAIQIQQHADPASAVTQQSAIPANKIEQPITGENTVTVSGWIGNEAGTGLVGVEVEVESSGFDGEKITLHKTTSGQRGEFIFAALISGRQYKLEIKPSGVYAGFSLDSFTAGQAKVPGEIILDRINLIDVDGMIVDTNHAPVANFKLEVRSLSVEYPDRSISSDSSGYFNLRAFPAGEVRIATNATDYYRIKGLELRADEYRNLTLVIDRGSYHLSGWVSDENGAPLAEVQVTLKSAFATDDYHSYSYRSKVTDANGTFDFSRLGGHPITLGVYADGFETHVRQHEFQSFSDTLQIRLGK